MPNKLALALEYLPPIEPANAECAPNRAVVRCCRAVEEVYQEVLKETGNDMKAQLLSRDAYAAAMPTLSSPESVRDFIACVAHGLLFGLLQETKAARLLYAAQVASGALGTRAASRGQRPAPTIAPER